MNYGAAEFQLDTNVSRETLERFQKYADLLAHWQRRINLVSSASLNDLWKRHFLDSAQMKRCLPEKSRQIWDIGTGAGFPGLVLAILGVPGISLIESDARKCAFLREAARVTEAPVSIVNARAEELYDREELSERPDVVLARALAPADKFLDIVSKSILCHTYCILLKGERYEEELSAARDRWIFEHEVRRSMTHPNGVVLSLRKIRHRNSNTKMGDVT